MPLIKTRGQPWSGSWQTCGVASTMTAPRPGAPSAPPSARTPAGRAPGSGARRCARLWLRRPPSACPHGRAASLRTCCGISAPASCMAAEWTWWRSRWYWATSVATTMRYIHVQATHVEDAWITGGSELPAIERPVAIILTPASSRLAALTAALRASAAGLSTARRARTADRPPVIAAAPTSPAPSSPAPGTGRRR